MFVTVFVCALPWVAGSVVRLNETTLDSLPPLYGLDDWTQCRRRGDVYCMVEAALLAPASSYLLDILKSYSNQTLKHYNRTLIHRGVCVTRCSDFSDTSWESAAQLCVNRSLSSYGLQAQVQSVEWCTSVGEEVPTSAAARALAVFCTALVALACLATALHVLGDRCVKADGNKYLMAFSLKRNWDILTYDRSKPRTDERMKDVACLEGIRFLGMQCVIFSHVLLIFIYSYIDNPEYIEHMYDQFGWQAILNSPLWLQAFFSISGFLTAYTVLLTCDAQPVTLVKCFLSVVNRWIRLTPLALFALWFTIAWFPLLGAGPQWAWLVAREAHECSERWWYHALYVHNHLPTGKFCMGHTWYLAADMQLHIIGILLIAFLMKYRKATVPVLLAIVLGSAAASGLLVYWYQLMPIITAQTPEVLRTMFAGSKILTLIYVPCWMNLPGYVGGIATAFLLHHNQVNAAKIDQKKWFNLLFHVSLIVGGCVVLAGTVFLDDSPPPLWASAVYAALDRTLVAVCFNIFMLGCVCGCKSVFRGLLEWRGFHILGRLSYCVFLIHFIVLRLILAGNTQLGHASILAMVSLLVTSSVLSYLVSVPLCLLVELPALQLWRALTGEPPRARARAPHPAAPPQPVVKPFDLVAHIRRRHEFC
ncbi:hypothetical protein O3G_MSEX012737 [Manduca sexta]|uniref:Acyltransferase 3 domain-containing protein n=1 Tax=Manduca sexta TaxID=7130 RepID=A0A921ZQI3_MANSE|nr:hypothetical protein O3G_MSEX012737 [Manduca sexta]